MGGNGKASGKKNTKKSGKNKEQVTQTKPKRRKKINDGEQLTFL